MKSGKSLIQTMIALIVIAALYRIIPNRPLGFAPQIAMALFGGAVIKDKKWAFALPVFSMFLSDLLYQALYSAGISDLAGFYHGQWINYLLFIGITLFGFLLKRITVLNVLGFSLASPTLFFFASNFFVWAGGGEDIRTHLPLAKNGAGLIQSLNQGLPFYTGALMATVVFSTLLFGGYYLLTKKNMKVRTV
jgi:hypothetical protein